MILIVPRDYGPCNVARLLKRKKKVFSYYRRTAKDPRGPLWSPVKHGINFKLMIVCDGDDHLCEGVTRTFGVPSKLYDDEKMRVIKEWF